MGLDERTGEQFMRAIKSDDQGDGSEIDQGDGIVIIFSTGIIIDSLGTHFPSKTDEFSEKFQTAFDPPPPLIFGKLCCNFF